MTSGSAAGLKYERGERTELLPPLDAFVCAELGRVVSTLEVRKIMLCEIGVWRGGWILTLLANLPAADGFGIDPYPESPGLAHEVVVEADRTGLGARFRMGECFEDFCERHCPEGHSKFPGVFHIDGEHSEDAVQRDLSFCLQHASQNAVIAVDDFWNVSFPGVMSAVVHEAYKGTVLPFLTTRQKMYLVPRQSDSSNLVPMLIHRLRDAGLAVQDGWRPLDGSSMGYDRLSTIAGAHVWQLVLSPDDEASLERRLKVGRRRRSRREIAKSWLPPALKDGLRLLRS